MRRSRPALGSAGPDSAFGRLKRIARVAVVPVLAMSVVPAGDASGIDVREYPAAAVSPAALTDGATAVDAGGVTAPGLPKQGPAENAEILPRGPETIGSTSATPAPPVPIAHRLEPLGAAPDVSLAAVDAAGDEMPVGDLPGWTQIFADDFTTAISLGEFPAASGGRWGAYPDGWRDTSGKGMYSAERTVSISNSVLEVWLRTEGGTPLVAALTPRLPGGNDQLYGRYAIRFRADPVPGYKTAWLLWPQSGVWPRDGEIDFPEGELTGTMKAFMHRQNGSSGADQDTFATNATYGDWHTAVIEWTPTAVTFILDGTVIGRSTSRIPNTPMHWVIQTETSLSGPLPPASASGSVQIDWVAVWRYTP